MIFFLISHWHPPSAKSMQCSTQVLESKSANLENLQLQQQCVDAFMKTFNKKVFILKSKILTEQH